MNARSDNEVEKNNDETNDAIDEVKKALGIDSFTNMSKKTKFQFATMLRDMDMQVALKIIEQSPEFAKFALDLLNDVESSYSATIKSNEQNVEQFYRGVQETRAILNGQLNRDNLTPDQWKFLIESILGLTKLESEKDTENKKFLSENFKTVAITSAAALLVGLAYVATKALPGGNNIKIG